MSILRNAKWASTIEDIDFSELLISDDVIQVALESFPSLHTLRLANCPNLSEKSIEYISESQRNRCNSNIGTYYANRKTSLSSCSSSTLSTSPSSVSELSEIIASLEPTLPATPLKALDLSCCCGIPDAEALLVKEGLVDLMMNEQL